MKETLKNLMRVGAAACVIASQMSCGFNDGPINAGPRIPGKTLGGAGNDVGRSVRQTPDGGFIIAGSTDSFGAGGSDVYLVRTDSSGSPLWEKTFGGPGDDDGYSVLQTSDGGYIIAGSTTSAGAGGSDIYLIRTDPSGGTLWERTFGGPGDDYGREVLEGQDGYAVSGTCAGADGGSQACLIRTDGSGVLLGETTFGGRIANPDGTAETWDVEGFAVEQASDGGYVIAGRAASLSPVADIPFVGLYGYDVYLAKTDSSGILLWEKTVGGPGDQAGNAVHRTSDGGYIIAGYDDIGGVLADVYLIKTDGSGNVVWDRSFGTGGSHAGYCVRQIPDGGYIITGVNGANSGDVYLIRTDSLGSPLWEKIFGGDGVESGSSVEQTRDGGYVVAGSTTSVPESQGGSDVYFLKTDANGGAE